MSRDKQIWVSLKALEKELNRHAPSIVSRSVMGRLVESVETGDIPRLQLLIATGVNLNDRSYDQLCKEWVTPLMSAAIYGQPGVARLLIAAGADLEVTSEEGERTALIWAAMDTVTETAAVETPMVLRGRVACAKVLIAAGAKIVARDRHGMTPLTCAIKSRYSGHAACADRLQTLAVRDGPHGPEAPSGRSRGLNENRPVLL